MSASTTVYKLNKMAKTVQMIEKYLPKSMYRYGYTMLFNTMVKLAGTAALQVKSLSNKEAIVQINNNRHVQNHIGGLHACTMALAAESASGIVIGMNVPDTHIPLIKEMNIKFIKRCSGNITAHAILSHTDYETIHTTNKGSISVNVTITDSTNQIPITTEMVWAWVPKK